jgi:hypothetical protein
LCLSIALFRRFSVPFHGLGLIFINTIANLLARSQTVLRVCISLFRRFAVPLHRLRSVFDNAIPIVITYPEGTLCLGVPLLGGFTALPSLVRRRNYTFCLGFAEVSLGSIRGTTARRGRLSCL